MTMPNISVLIEKIEMSLDLLVGLQGPSFDTIRQDLNDVRDDLYIIEQHQAEINNYDNYVEELERNLQRTAPWIFNHYIDPEDLLDYADEDDES